MTPEYQNTMSIPMQVPRRNNVIEEYEDVPYVIEEYWKLRTPGWDKEADRSCLKCQRKFHAKTRFIRICGLCTKLRRSLERSYLLTTVQIVVER